MKNLNKTEATKTFNNFYEELTEYHVEEFYEDEAKLIYDYFSKTNKDLYVDFEEVEDRSYVITIGKLTIHCATGFSWYGGMFCDITEMFIYNEKCYSKIQHDTLYDNCEEAVIGLINRITEAFSLNVEVDYDSICYVFEEENKNFKEAIVEEALNDNTEVVFI